MDDDKINNNDLHIETGVTSDGYEETLQKEFNRKKSITELQIPLSARSIIVPATNAYPERHIIMTDINNPDKEALYKLIVSAYNYVFYDKFAAVTAKDSFSCSAPNFIAWLNGVEIKNRYEVLKDYEAYRFDVLNNHGGSSDLKRVKGLFSYALDHSLALYNHLTQIELSYLQELRKTKISPNYNKKQKSLSSYFGGLDWLRRDDVGIGNDLYSALSSPKLTVKSLILTASTIIVEFEKYKRELRLFLNSCTLKDTVYLLPLVFKELTTSGKKITVGSTLYQLFTGYHLIEVPKLVLRNALEVLLLSNVVSEQVFKTVKKALESQSQCDEIFLNKIRCKAEISTEFCEASFTTQYSGNLLSIEQIYCLTQNNISYPITEIEGLMFTWLMASLTVQPFNISKLKHSSFRLLKVGGKVKHIECEYFKGRSKVFHTTRSLSINSIEGQALIAYLSQHKGVELLVKNNNYRISNGIISLTGRLALLLTTDAIKTSLIEQHKKQDNLPLIIPNTLISLIKHGTNAANVVGNINDYPFEVQRIILQESNTPCSSILFGLQAIKNSAVHAFSDPYTLHYLINRNSHTNKTEKNNYLNSDNEEWINAAGRITREVMLDLINNVFNLEFEHLDVEAKEKAVERFNSEFMAVTDNMSYKTEEMLVRLKVTTEQSKGKMNEVGVLALDNDADIQKFPPLYIVDSPITAWKMNNYLHEFNKHYKKLLAQNPEYFYKTVMPTVEWIENALNKLSKESQRAGRKMLKEMLKQGSVASVFHSI